MEQEAYVTGRADERAADLEAIRKRCEAASPGPWFIVDRAEDLVGIPAEDKFDVRQFQAHGEPCWDYDKDMDFIINARQDVPALLAHVAKLEAELREAQDYDAMIALGSTKAERDTAVEAAANLECEKNRYRMALKQITNCLGPTAPKHGCEGCRLEITEALNIANITLRAQEKK